MFKHLQLLIYSRYTIKQMNVLLLNSYQGKLEKETNQSSSPLLAACLRNLKEKKKHYFRLLNGINLLSGHILVFQVIKWNKPALSGQGSKFRITRTEKENGQPDCYIKAVPENPYMRLDIMWIKSRPSLKPSEYHAKAFLSLFRKI